ncbi:MAG: hypothetical protein ACOQNV_00040 [Mycoplasmoidaceae bacterium]
MKLWVRNTWAITVSLLIVGIFTATCVCTYKYHWSLAAFWWSWFGLVWIIDLFVGGYLFYKRNRTDETKTFWLLVMIALPIVGAALALIFNYRLKTEYGKPDNDHSKLQAMLFRAKKSIKIYSNSFFASADTFNALNYARWKNVKIELIITIQKQKRRQEFLIFCLQKALENKIELHLTDKQIVESFIIVDDELIITSASNFNFVNIYSKHDIKGTTDITRYQRIWKNDLEKTSAYPLERDKISVFKKLKFKLLNIFYPFF